MAVREGFHVYSLMDRYLLPFLLCCVVCSIVLQTCSLPDTVVHAAISQAEAGGMGSR